MILSNGHFQPSENTYDWLGKSFYLWEFAPQRAYQWAQLTASLHNDEPAVLQVTVRLGFCVNLLDTRHVPGLIEVHHELSDTLSLLPVNTLRGAHYLDRLVIDTYCDFHKEQFGQEVQTVRGCFPEGGPIYMGSRIFSKAHVQIAVRDPDCIENAELVPLTRENIIL